MNGTSGPKKKAAGSASRSFNKVSQLSLYPLPAIPPEWQHHDETNRDDNLANFHAGCLPDAKEWHLGPGLPTKTKHICHACKSSDHISSTNQTQTNISQDGLVPVAPLDVQADVASQTDHCQANQENCNLDKAHHRAAIQAKKGRPCTDHENQQAEEGQDQSSAQTGFGTDYFSPGIG